MVSGEEDTRNRDAVVAGVDIELQPDVAGVGVWVDRRIGPAAGELAQPRPGGLVAQAGRERVTGAGPGQQLAARLGRPDADQEVGVRLVAEVALDGEPGGERPGQLA